MGSNTNSIRGLRVNLFPQKHGTAFTNRVARKRRPTPVVLPLGTPSASQNTSTSSVAPMLWQTPARCRRHHGVCYRTLQYWVAWYREGGLAEVLQRIPGHGSGPTAKLTPVRQRELAAKVALPPRGEYTTPGTPTVWHQQAGTLALSFREVTEPHAYPFRIAGRTPSSASWTRDE